MVFKPWHPESWAHPKFQELAQKPLNCDSLFNLRLSLLLLEVSLSAPGKELDPFWKTKMYLDFSFVANDHQLHSDFNPSAFTSNVMDDNFAGFSLVLHFETLAESWLHWTPLWCTLGSHLKESRGWINLHM